MRGLSGCLLVVLLAACDATDPTPAFELAEGRSAPLAEFSGKWIFLNYWATWCKPCLEEIPELNAFHAAHAERDAVVMGIDFDETGGAALAAKIRELDIRFPVLVQAPDWILQGERPAVMPTTYVIGPDGTPRGALLGPQTAETLQAVMQEGPT